MEDGGRMREGEGRREGVYCFCIVRTPVVTFDFVLSTSTSIFVH